MRELYFFIGTEAEIMKMFTVVRRARAAGFDCKIISSGQNVITQSPFLPLCDSKIDVDMSVYKPEGKTGGNYLQWFLRTLRFGSKQMRQIVKKANPAQPPVMVVHGDTLSTLLGAMIARRAGMPHVHVEGGPRSGHWLNPFPEEIDRYFSSVHAEMVFCPNEESAATARRSFSGEAVSTVYNTNIETLQHALHENQLHPIARVYEGPYFILALHRQENLLNRSFMEQAIDSAIRLAKKIHGVFIYHQQTMDALQKYDLLHKLEQCPDITIVPRMAHLDFIDAVDKAEFLAADGAGNQQEMYYLGKPYLILRRHIEKEGEGQGYNCIGFEGDFERLAHFDEEYKGFCRPAITPEVLPSEIIVDALVRRYGGK